MEKRYIALGLFIVISVAVFWYYGRKKD